MSFNYVKTQNAIHADGLRMIVVSGVPSPWSEAAKGICYVKNIEFQAVRLNPRNPEQMKWAGYNSAPVAIFNNEAPVKDWDAILELTERIQPNPPLLPQDDDEKALAHELSNLLCGQDGLGWWRRLQGIHAALTGQDVQEGGFPRPIAQYLAPKYGYLPETGPIASQKVVHILETLSARLKAQAAKNSPYYIGHTLSCVDIYSATICAAFAPLPHEQCAMQPEIRATFESMDEVTRKAFDPLLTQHRDYIYANHLKLPLSL